MKAVTRRLRVLRVERGLSQRETAVRAGLPEGRYQRIEAGYVTPSNDDLAALAKVFRLEPDQVLSDRSAVAS